MDLVAEMASEVDEWEFVLRKYILMLATLVATVTYGVGFNPPGGVWQENDGPAGHRAGEPIIQTINNLRYLVFFYCSAFALASSVVVIVIFLLLSIDLAEKKFLLMKIRPLRVLMVLDLVSFMGAYAAGSCRDMFTTIYTSVLMAAGVSIYLTAQVVHACGSRTRESPALPTDQDKMKIQLEERLRKVLMLLATFALSITYVSGLNPPGGFWDNTMGGHHPGEVILDDGRHKARLAIFFVCNTTAFMASLLIIMPLLGRKLLRIKTVRSREMSGCILVVLVGLVGAYAAGSSREPVATTYVVCVVAAGLVCIQFLPEAYLWKQGGRTNVSRQQSDHNEERMRSHQSRSLLLLLATFATPITYQAGLDPPGGFWQENGSGHLAGDPILLSMNASRYMTFFYCNSFAFGCSLFTITKFVTRLKLNRQVVDKFIVMELLGLVGAYAAGASRDVSTSNAVLALAGAVLFYVTIHVAFLTLDNNNLDPENRVRLDKKRKLLYLLATLSTAMTYQAGLTPPGGFWLQDDNEFGHQAGDPILLYSHPVRYKVFFYCNSVSFMVSITTMILLVNPNLYRPAIRSSALNLCTVVGLSCLLGAYAAGGNRHLRSSIGIYVLGVIFFLTLLVVLLTCLVMPLHARAQTLPGDLILSDDEQEAKKLHGRRKHLMLLGILLAGVTYQAGLHPPGGVWQQNGDPGNPVLLDMRMQQYLSFFYSNSTSFVASIVVIVLLLLHFLKENLRLHSWVMRSVILLDLLALLVAYAAGSNRDRKSSLIITIPILTYSVINGILYAYFRRKHAQRIIRDSNNFRSMSP